MTGISLKLFYSRQVFLAFLFFLLAQINKPRRVHKTLCQNENPPDRNKKNDNKFNPSLIRCTGDSTLHSTSYDI
jgi:hypothetical protein